MLRSVFPSAKQPASPFFPIIYRTLGPWSGRQMGTRMIIDLPEGLFREAEARASLDGVTVKDLVIRYVEQGLQQDKQPSATPSGRRRSELPIARAATGRVLPALTSAEIDRILEEGEARSGRRD
jgi:hypothetical protein